MSLQIKKTDYNVFLMTHCESPTSPPPEIRKELLNIIQITFIIVRQKREVLKGLKSDLCCKSTNAHS